MLEYLNLTLAARLREPLLGEPVGVRVEEGDIFASGAMADADLEVGGLNKGFLVGRPRLRGSALCRCW